MLIGLHDAEKDYLLSKSFPNLALMKLSSYHKQQGDSVLWWNPLLSNECDIIYSSKVFDFSPDNSYLPSETIRGGTGYEEFSNELSEVIEDQFPDYTIYPKVDYALGYITRGCPNHCEWCIVPFKEGNIKPAKTFDKLVRKDTNKLVLLDNNILASDFGIAQLEALTKTDYKIDLTQGMDARLVDDKIAEILSKIKWIKYIRFSCDQVSQIKHIQRAAELLNQNGVKHNRLMVYLLIRHDLEDAEYRIHELKKLQGISLYAQAELNPRIGIHPTREQKEFCRYVYSGVYKKSPFTQWMGNQHIS